VKNVEIITIESDFGAGKKGAKLGPQAFLKNINSAWKSKIPITRVESNHLFEEEPHPGNYAKNIQAILSVQEQAIAVITEVAQKGAFPWIISGDHSNGLAGISAYRELYPNNRLGVIWIDAHADLHTPFTSPSGNMHGMPLAAALGLSKKTLSKNEVDKTALMHWEALINLGDKKLSPKLNPSEIVFLELRDLEMEEIALLKDLDILHYVPQERKEMGIAKVIAEVADHLKNCHHILISFDVDSLDPTVSFGTGTPVPGGLLRQDAVELLVGLLKLPNLFAFEITEINPLLDRITPMEEVAASLIEDVFEKTGFIA
jgi:arginase